jgi:hypothetical protein
MKRKDLQHIKLESTLLKVNEMQPADAFLTEGIELKQTYSQNKILRTSSILILQVSHPIYAGLMQRCTCADLGRANMQDYCRRKQCFYRRNLAAGQKEDFLSLLIYLHTAVMIRITSVVGDVKADRH